MSDANCGPMIGQRMDEDQLKLWILRRLGAPLLKIELTEEHLDDAIMTALHWYAAKKGFVRNYKQQLTPNITQYQLEPYVDVVTDVVFPLSVYDLTPMNSPWGWAWPQENLGMPLGGSVGGWAGSGASTLGIVSSYQQVLQYADMARRVFNGELEWRQEDRTLYILPYRQTASSFYPAAIVFYTSTRFTLLDLNERDHDLVKRFALAQAKMDLGRIRSKYDSYPTAQGTVNLDGATILEEGKAEVEALNEELGESAKPTGFITG